MLVRPSFSDRRLPFENLLKPSPLPRQAISGRSKLRQRLRARAARPYADATDKLAASFAQNRPPDGFAGLLACRETGHSRTSRAWFRPGVRPARLPGIQGRDLAPLVNNAANFYAGFFEELTPEQIEEADYHEPHGPDECHPRHIARLWESSVPTKLYQSRQPPALLGLNLAPHTRPQSSVLMDGR